MIFKKIKLKYNFEKFLNADYSIHTGSCIFYQKSEQKDIHNTLGEGFLPKSYNEHNTKIHQLWFNSDQIDYKEIGSQLNMEVVTVSSILQPPGNVITLHKDTFFQINKKFPNDKRTKVRANIFLQDWEVGHIIQYKDPKSIWKTSTCWNQGQGFLWDSDIIHIGANIGLTDKYTLQISGFLLS